MEKELAKVQGKLGNENFLKKAPAEIVKKEKEKKEALEARLEKIQKHFRMLEEAE